MAKTFPVNRQLTIPGDPAHAHGLLLSQLNPVLAQHGLTFVADAGTSVSWKRRYTPDWAVVLAVIGALIFLLGLLFLLYKEEDTLVASVQGYGDKTLVTFTGGGPKALPEVLDWFESVNNPAQQGWYDDPEAPGQQRFWNGTGWTEQRRESPTPPPA